MLDAALAEEDCTRASFFPFCFGLVTEVYAHQRRRECAPWKHLQVAAAVHTPLEEQLLAQRGGPPTGVQRACSAMRAFSCRYTSLLYTAMYTLQHHECQ